MLKCRTDQIIEKSSQPFQQSALFCQEINIHVFNWIICQDVKTRRVCINMYKPLFCFQEIHYV